MQFRKSHVRFLHPIIIHITTASFSTTSAACLPAIRSPVCSHCTVHIHVLGKLHVGIHRVVWFCGRLRRYMHGNLVAHRFPFRNRDNDGRQQCCKRMLKLRSYIPTTQHISIPFRAGWISTTYLVRVVTVFEGSITALPLTLVRFLICTHLANRRRGALGQYGPGIRFGEHYFHWRIFF